LVILSLLYDGIILEGAKKVESLLSISQRLPNVRESLVAKATQAQGDVDLNG
jgi:hypothetical protein